MFHKLDEVQSSRDIKAGLSEDGPEICKKGTKGIVLEVQPNEPDGVLVRLLNNVEWWFKPNQLEKIHEQ